MYICISMNIRFNVKDVYWLQEKYCTNTIVKIHWHSLTKFACLLAFLLYIGTGVTHIFLLFAFGVCPNVFAWYWNKYIPLSILFGPGLFYIIKDWGGGNLNGLWGCLRLFLMLANQTYIEKVFSSTLYNIFGKRLRNLNILLH